jgi:phospho-N-acetylmuramoyl-pentapeptide-transferase
VNGAFTLLVGLLSFGVTMLAAPSVVKLMKKLKASQTVLGYVEQHSHKTGTPTLGGVLFVVPTIALTLLFGYSKLSLVASATLFAYAVLGFLDDFLKIKNRQNLGLRAYQKVIGQVGIAVIVAWFCYTDASIGSAVRLPFSDKLFDMGVWYLPFTVFVYLAVTNSVNLTDGLDGLAGFTSLVYLLVFCVIGISQGVNIGLIVFITALIGGLSGFLWQNAYPAKIMMGDTGSLALGGAAATVAVFSKNPLLIPLVGIMFVVSSISVILQVASFKLRGKRIFLMSPYHHHLEKKR